MHHNRLIAVSIANFFSGNRDSALVSISCVSVDYAACESGSQLKRKWTGRTNDSYREAYTRRCLSRLVRVMRQSIRLPVFHENENVLT